MIAAAAEATRQVDWRVSSTMTALLYASMAAALLIFAYGIWRRLRIWRLGRPASVWDHPVARLRRMLFGGIGHARIVSRRLPGIAHALLFAGIAVLFSATVITFVHQDLGLRIMRGRLYLYYQSLTVDLLGLAVLVAVALAAWRRYVLRPPGIEQGRAADAVLLGGLFLITLTGFALEGIRIRATHDAWGSWSPVGSAAGSAMHAVAPDRSLEDAYASIWLLHVFMWHACLAAIPFTKMIHLVTAPLNLFFSDPNPARATVAPIDFTASAERLGVATPFDFTWRQLFALDACTECGRCQDVCPAFAAGKPLSPKHVVLDLRDHVRAHASDLLRTKTALKAGAKADADRLATGTLLAGGVIAAETLWACTTCRACEEACPVGIEHVPLIIDLRRNLAMVQAAVPAQVAETVAGLEARQHPFRGTSAARTDWYEGLSVPVVESAEQVGDFDVLYWVGCAAALDGRAQSVARALVRIMQHASVRFGILGGAERCCGDFARRTGSEFHYAMLASANMQMLCDAGQARIVTHCAHCLQALKHEYAPWEAQFEVLHHSELIASLIDDGRLTLKPRPRDEPVTFHDPCYLGRYNRIFDPPRRVLDAVSGERVEMQRSREMSFCCGSGGGHAFYADASGTRINGLRVAQAASTGATTIATGCPFCLTMLEDGVRASSFEGDQLRVRDLAELVAEALMDRES